MLNTTATGFGLMSSVGLMIVANFQETHCYYIHFIGALTCIWSGSIYLVLQVLISFIVFLVNNIYYLDFFRHIIIFYFIYFVESHIWAGFYISKVFHWCYSRLIFSSITTCVNQPDDCRNKSVELSMESLLQTKTRSYAKFKVIFYEMLNI